MSARSPADVSRENIDASYLRYLEEQMKDTLFVDILNSVQISGVHKQCRFMLHVSWFKVFNVLITIDEGG